MAPAREMTAAHAANAHAARSSTCLRAALSTPGFHLSSHPPPPPLLALFHRLPLNAAELTSGQSSPKATSSSIVREHSSPSFRKRRLTAKAAEAAADEQLQQLSHVGSPVTPMDLSAGGHFPSGTSPLAHPLWRIPSLAAGGDFWPPSPHALSRAARL